MENNQKTTQHQHQSNTEGNDAQNGRKNLVHFSICACHPCARAMLIFSVSFQFYRMIPERNPMNLMRLKTKQHKIGLLD